MIEPGRGDPAWSPPSPSSPHLCSDELAIEARGLTRRYGQLPAVAGLDFAVQRGDIFGLVGPDGAGKTTTIRMLCGALSPSSGTALVAGCDVVREPEQLKERIGYMAQRFSLYPDLTVQENLDFVADLYRVPRQVRQARMDEALRFSRLEAFRGRLAGQLSGGMKQKLALAATLIHRPEVLLLDEPTTGVDPVSRREFWHILQQLLHEGLTIFYSTPYMDEAERCTTVAFISQGHLIAVGPPDQFRQRMAASVLELQATPLRLAREVCRRLPVVEDVQTFGDRLHLTLKKSQEASTIAEPEVAKNLLGAQAMLLTELESQGVEMSNLHPVDPSLEDVFMWLNRRFSTTTASRE